MTQTRNTPRSALFSPSDVRGERASFSVPSLVAIGCIVASFFFEGLDVILAFVAITFGVIGMVMALSPTVRGGVVSTFAVVAGVLVICISFLQLIF
jgi:hypothetical protein